MKFQKNSKKYLIKQGIKFKLNSKVKLIEDKKNSVIVEFTDVNKTKKETLKAEQSFSFSW